MPALLVEYWRVVLVGGTAVVVLAVRHRVPGWVPAAGGLLVAAVALAWLVDWSWLGTTVVYVFLLAIASAMWLRAEERRASRCAGPDDV